jgi:hypothetical protein
LMMIAATAAKTLMQGQKILLWYTSICANILKNLSTRRIMWRKENTAN